MIRDWHIDGRRYALSPRQLLLSLGVLAVLLTSAVTGWICWGRGSQVNEIPAVNLTDVDPELNRAVREASEAVRRAPRSPKAWGKLAMVLHANGFDESALRCYVSAANLDRYNPQWPHLAGVLLEVGPHPEEAIGQLERAASLSPPNSMARLRLADALLEQGRFDEAAREYQVAAAEDPHDAYALYGLAKLALAQQRYQDALRILRAVAGSPLVQNKACLVRANIQERLGNRPAAAEERKQLAGLPGDVWRLDDPINEVLQFEVGAHVYLDRAQLLSQQDRVAEMVEVLQEGVASYPQSAEVWAALGFSLGRANDLAGAGRALHKSVELAPFNADHRLSLAMWFIAQRRFKEAQDPLKVAIELRPTYGAAHFELGECLHEAGDDTGAIQAYTAAIRYSPDIELARQRLEKLHEKR